ncbi:T9SS type A sorting domain-containing protein [Cytophagaceae bacterium YF14B1]|uniref:T9SS type A sorting domain-containing protein n=1 Tax=Xanthocytophaga flava TaxID=3048013 RepID=A0AAE3QNE2_9BACT|nr:T9SS type A sorting domain-containing protein [Xanthocytophaga flavus]MDJ1482542.1 T9SS type A sorting domain-containing protein [Xanthocytophaga flavus]
MLYSYFSYVLHKPACWFALAFCFLSAWSVQAQGGVSASQYQALVSLYNSTGGPNWYIKDNWLSAEPVNTWYGVSVDSTGKVVVLNLSYNNLTGNLPASLSNLPLVELQVSGNQLARITALPASLVSLNADNNMISALPSLPSKLEILRINSNQVKSLPTLPVALTVLDASSNLLSSLPSLPARLTNLSVSTNRISSLPTLPVALTSLNISSNRISTLPALPANLGSLIVSSNRISSLPTLPSTLSYLNVSGNRLSALPTLPAGLSISIVNENRLTFEDLEPIINRFFDPGFYAPQADIGNEGIVVTAAGCSIQLSANYAGNSANNQYIWFKDSVAIDTLTTPYLMLNSIKTDDAGTYTCQVSNTLVPGLVLNRKPIYVYVYGGSSSTSVRVSSPESQREESSLTIGPNPFVDALYVFGTHTSEQKAHITITDVQGRLVYESSAHSLTQPIQLDKGLPSALYVMRVSMGAKTQTFSIVKQ